ncbi:hypothetical protein M422DRAFT_53529 [Sphaerobolus stellatus SS14]|uniref:C2 domain-containing protein n=1 Tax=Sphaerobolus stellatus (strain SS14) TaxID=990650 RepID=A0A0C9V085_SPHS4|nr:hypothetical protein M422DRAFT_53529 [Sphaerobolus stellatus SS14]
MQPSCLSSLQQHTTAIEITNISAKDLPKIHWPHEYSVQFELGNQNQLTQRKKRNKTEGNVKWDDTVIINISPNFSKLKLLLYDQGLLSLSHCLGQANLDLTLCTDLENGFTGEVTLETDRKEVVGLLNLHIKRRDLTQHIEFERARIVLGVVDKSAPGMVSPPQIVETLQDGIEAVDKLQQSVDALTGLSPRLVTLVESLETFVNNVASIAEIHPYAYAAWNLLTFAVKVCPVFCIEANKSINTLIDTMHEMYAILVEMQLWRRVSKGYSCPDCGANEGVRIFSHRLSVGETKERFCTIHNKLQPIQTKINDFKDCLGKLKSSLTDRLTINSNIAVVRVLDAVETIGI